MGGNWNMKKRLLASLLSLAAALALLPAAAMAQGPAEIVTDGGLTAKGNCTYADGTLTITGDTTVRNTSGTLATDSISIQGDSEEDPIEVTLDGVKLEAASGSAIMITGRSSHVTLILNGENTVKAGYNRFYSGCGIHLNGQYCQLTIRGNGSLETHGYEYGGSGIEASQSGIEIAIESGTVAAYGYGDGVGIGASTTQNPKSNITISSGTVKAVAKGSGAALGGGVKNISISNAEVTATASSGAAIGGEVLDFGTGGSSITISESTVTAKSTSGAAIGWERDPGNYKGTVDIKSSNVLANSERGVGIGGVKTEQSDVTLNINADSVVVTSSSNANASLSGVVLTGTGIVTMPTVEGATVSVGEVNIPADGSAFILVDSGKTLNGTIEN